MFYFLFQTPPLQKKKANKFTFGLIFYARSVDFPANIGLSCGGEGWGVGSLWLLGGHYSDIDGLDEKITMAWLSSLSDAPIRSRSMDFYLFIVHISFIFFFFYFLKFLFSFNYLFVFLVRDIGFRSLLHWILSTVLRHLLPKMAAFEYQKFIFRHCSRLLKP